MFGFDIDQYDADTTETQMAAGNLLPVGKYHAKLTGAKEVTSKKDGKPGHELEFEVLGGVFNGFTVKDTLWEGDKTASRNRLLLFACRLGVLRKEGAKFVKVPGVETFDDARKKGAEVVIDVVHREYDRTDGTKGKAANLSFAGLFDLSDPKVAEVARGPAGAGAGTATAAAPRLSPDEL